MANTTDFKKTLADATPLYAFVGAGDLAVEKIRTVPDRLSGMKIDVSKIELPKFDASRIDIPTDPKIIRTRVSNTAADVQERVSATFSTITAAGKEAPGKAQDFAKAHYDRAGDYAAQLKEIYDELAERGHKVVDKLNKKESEAKARARKAAPRSGAGAKPTPGAGSRTEPKAASRAEPKPSTAPKPKPPAKPRTVKKTASPSE